MMKKLAAALLAGGLIIGLLGPASAKPKKMWEDTAGDADAGQGLGASVPAGLDLVEGAIELKGKDLVFSVTHADMPPAGSLPEGARFLWAFAVNGTGYRWTFKSADIGKPDVVGGQTDERVGRVDAQGHFRLESDCGSETVGALNTINCKPIGYYEGAIDAATATVSMTVPLKDIGAKPGAVISPAGGNEVAICALCWVTHAAERSLDATIIDTAVWSTNFKLPKKK
jgi:hypothetical protein